MKNFVLKPTYAYALLSLLMSSFTAVLSADMISTFGIQGGIQGGVGYRQDSISWKMEDFEKVNPTANSDVHFKDLEIILLGVKFKGLLAPSLYSRASFDYGWIIDGSMREELTLNNRHKSDHFDNNGLLTEGRFNRAVVYNKEKGNSYVFDLDIGFGLPFYCCCDTFQIAPMIGFSYDRQQIKIGNRERIFAHPNRHFPQILSGDEVRHCTKSSYSFSTAWWGPWIGFDFFYVVNCWNLFGEFELHYGRAERNRNSSVGIEYFDHYSRTKTFWGTTSRLGANYTCDENWYIEATISYTHWASNMHRDTLYLSSGTARLDAGYRF